VQRVLRRLRRPISPPPDTLVVDDLAFRLRWSRRRTSIGIAVTRAGELRVAAPCGAPPGQIESFVRAKLPWVRRKLAEFAALGDEIVAVRLVSGERLPYLGRRYTVERVETSSAPVRLSRGRLEIDTGLDGEAAGALRDWYVRRAQARVTTRLGHFAPLVGAHPTELRVRDIGRRRWGVCDCRRRVVSLHWQLITLPPDLLDYVLVHELCHLLVPNHSPAFWRHVERVLPDYKAKRRRLAVDGRRLAL